ncbi:uncharacterized protein LOC141724372 [Apium graveolens]|uniref:uncharacterized protein LOC141724372 n=1 Tax=Apium graveolens TaxID=4045 RepID=UPI003D79235B
MKIFQSPPNTRSNHHQINPLKSLKFSLTHLLIFLIFTLSVNSSTITPKFLQVPYAKHCNDVVSETPSVHLTNLTLDLPSGVFSGGTEILGRQNALLAGKGLTGSMFFRTHFVYDTTSDHIFEVQGRLSLMGRRGIGRFRRGLRLVSYRAPRIPIRAGQAVFKLHGFWNAESGKMCMVGSGVSYLRDVNVVLILDYLNVSSISNSFVKGTLRNLGNVGDKDYFQGIEILGVSMKGYNFTLVESEKRNGVFSEYDRLANVSLGFKRSEEVCSVVKYSSRVELDYSDDCGADKCKVLGRGSEVVPTIMVFDEVECLENGRVRYLLRLLNSSPSSFHLLFDPSTTLVAEGEWDWVKKRMDLVACRIVNYTESLSKGSVGDCSIRLILRVPAWFSLRNRSVIVGQMWSKKMVNESGYFARVFLRSEENQKPRLDGLKYKYADYQNFKKACTKNIKAKRKGKTYPDGHTSDMRFDMTARNEKGHRAWGYSYPLSVGDKFYDQHQLVSDQTKAVVDGNLSRSNMINISYVMNFKDSANFKLGAERPLTSSVFISAEGIYDADTGFLCMIGCRHLSSHNKIKNNNSIDCEIVVTAEYPPLNAKDGGNVKGKIQSTRSKVDPQYFDGLEFHSNSVYTHQAKQSLWRMDLEITMVLFSNTLACIFVGLQLFYVYKHPDVLPFISIVMLVILTLAHMIPLLLNFEAMFLSNHRRQTLFSGNDGWLEINEVLVRVITMIAFLMEFRLLQLTWSARSVKESLKNLWVFDKKVLYLSLPLYIGGGLIAWFVHLLTKPHTNIILLELVSANSTQISLLGELKSFAGLVRDVILLPQIIFNLFCDSKVKALDPFFYVGTTLLRLLPHAYDLYRAHSSSWSFTYIYANPRMDYYSTVWDISICCAGVLFVFIIFLQQQFGGRFFLPRRYKENVLYEKVPVTGTE